MMLTAAPALMTGPFDWHEQSAPRAVFAARLARVWAEAAGDDEIVLVHGDRAEFAMLAWVSHFTPKLGPALAVFSRDLAPELLFSGGAGMAESARRLTWIGAVRACSDPARDLAGLAGRRVALLGAAALTRGLRQAILAAVGPGGRVRVIDDAVLAWRRRKDGCEIARIRDAARALGAFGAAVGGGRIDAARAAHAAGAQEVRTARVASGLHVAVRAGLYWARGWLGAGDLAALDRLCAGLRPGMVLAGGQVGGIGLSLDEPPGPGARLVAGDVVVLRLGGVSAMVLVGVDGPETLWRSPGG